jgi:hypothetical protein
VGNVRGYGAGILQFCGNFSCLEENYFKMSNKEK